MSHISKYLCQIECSCGDGGHISVDGPMPTGAAYSSEICLELNELPMNCRISSLDMTISGH